MSSLNHRGTEARRIAFFLLAALLLATPLAACGKKGNLEPPPGEESTYPRQYPTPEPYPVPEETEAQ